MDPNTIIITDPNYRDPIARMEFFSIEKKRSAEKLAYAAAREEKRFNQPWPFEALYRRLSKIKQQLTKQR